MLSSRDLLIHVDFAKSYTNCQQDAIKLEYFGQHKFLIYTACTFTKDGETITNNNVTVVSESPDHNRACSKSCIKQVAKKVEEIENMEFENLVIWFDGCAVQFRGKFVFYIVSRMFPKKL